MKAMLIPNPSDDKQTLGVFKLLNKEGLLNEVEKAREYAERVREIDAEIDAL